MNKLLKRCLILAICIGCACGLIACGDSPDSASSSLGGSSSVSTGIESNSTQSTNTESNSESSEEASSSSTSDSSSVGGVWTPPTIQP